MLELSDLILGSIRHLDWGLIYIVLGYLAFESLFLLFSRRPVGATAYFSKSGAWDLFSFFLLVSGLGYFLGNSFVFGLQSYFQQSISVYRLQFSESFPYELRVVFAILAYDFLSYWRHRFFHSHTIFWAAHNFHHATTKLTALSNFRSHPIQNFFSTMLVGIPLTLIFGLKMNEIFVFFFISNISNLFSHGRIDTNLGWLGRNVFVTPRFHHLHHAVENTTHCNFGDIFIFWDRLFGTYKAPDVSIHTIQTGINNNFFESESMPKAFMKTVWIFYWEIFSVLIILFGRIRTRINESL
jgi:sterol desaturase/sphingolipid hydroxylase (fatty acid hydroxylase superfamily)